MNTIRTLLPDSALRLLPVLLLAGAIPVCAMEPEPVADPEIAPEPGIAGIYRSVFRIESSSQSFDYQAPWNSGVFGTGSGTGFLVGPNRILTNAHVVRNSRRLLIRKFDDPGVYSARILFVAQDSDLALIELEDPACLESLSFLELGDIPVLESEVRVIGYPIGGQRLSVTRGVVSRIDFVAYSFSGIDSHLAIQIDAAINPGNSGGPVLQGDHVVGVAFQGMRGSAEGTGYIIPTTVIRRFLADIEDGRYNGFVELGILVFNVFNPTLRRALDMPDNNRGVVVTRVFAQGSCDGFVEPGDILLEIEGHPIFSDGRIHLDGVLVDMREVVERKLDGETVSLRFLRHGESREAEVALSPFLPARIHAVEHERRPAYAMFGGLVFQPVSQNMLSAYSLDTLEIRKVLDDYLPEGLYLDQPEVVVLTQVLTDSINAEIAGLSGLVVTSINDEPVRQLRDLVRLLFDPMEAGTLPEFVVVRCRGFSRPIILESAGLRSAQARIRAQYGVANDYHLSSNEPGSDGRTL